jgi:predicted ATPase/transcriptional regulator with XRE-family HTH domain
MMVEFVSAEVVMTTKISFGQWLKQRRKALDLTREDLAGRIGCAANTIYKIEADERRPSKQIAALLAQHLNIPPDEHAAFIQFARAETVESSVLWGTPFHSPTNLPTQPTLLIGRGADVAAIRKRLLQPESRLLTLIGPPGIGKTRLALQVANQTLDDFADGVFLIALAPISDANLVSTTIASTLGVPDVGPQTPLQRLQTFLRDKQMLLVLDNFEQILTAAPQIAELLAACPWLKILVTSRSPLRIRQERQIPVSPLAVPDLAHLPDVENVTHYSAVTLFLERAQAVKPDFSLNSENAPTVAAICARLDGLPLAIELISARVKLLAPAALLERLHGRLMLQSDGLRDIEPRHRTLNAAIDWSYQLLSSEEQTLFRRLGVFVGGWTLEAAESICKENLNLNILDGLASLLDKNLVKEDNRSDGEPRFTMLETIGEYALKQLDTAQEAEQIWAAHCEYFSNFMRQQDDSLRSKRHKAGLAAIRNELDNVRSAWQWAITYGNTQEIGKSVQNLYTYAELDDLALKEAEKALGAAVKRLRTLSASQSPEAELSKALVRQAHLCYVLSINHEQSIEVCKESLAIFQRYRLLEEQALALRVLGLFLGWNGDSDEARLLLHEGLALYRKCENLDGMACTLQALGAAAYSMAVFDDARRFFQEALDLFQKLDHPTEIAWCDAWLGNTAIQQGLYVEA